MENASKALIIAGGMLYYKYVQFKRMKFKHKETTFYDTGRVKMMSFIETR